MKNNLASFIKTSLDMKDLNSSDIELSLENNFNLEMNFDPFKIYFFRWNDFQQKNLLQLIFFDQNFHDHRCL